MVDTLSVLYDHYKDTCKTIGEAIKRRERLMLWLVLALGSFALLTAFPSETGAALNQFLNFKFGFVLSVGLSVIETVLWYVFLILMIRYFQTVVLIERRYNYIHQLEKFLNKELEGELITREGKSYDNDYPLFTKWVSILYSVVFPILLFVGSTVKIADDWFTLTVCPPLPYLILNTVAYALIIISITLYLTMIHWPKDKNKAKEQD